MARLTSSCALLQTFTNCTARVVFLKFEHVTPLKLLIPAPRVPDKLLFNMTCIHCSLVFFSAWFSHTDTYNTHILLTTSNLQILLYDLDLCTWCVYAIPSIWIVLHFPTPFLISITLTVPFFFFFFLRDWGLNSGLQAWCSTAWVLPPAHFALFILKIGFCELFA
jgi:hypothetical protein